MVTQIVVYLSLLLQIVAMGFAISLFKRTKFNAAWILISTGFFFDGDLPGDRIGSLDAPG